MGLPTSILDTNIVSRIEVLPHMDREGILEALEDVPLRTSIELIEENLAVAETRRPDELEVRGRFLLAATRVAPHREYPDVVRGELTGSMPPQITPEEHQRLRRALRDLAAGTAPIERLRPMAGEIREEKETGLARYQEIQALIRAKFQGKRRWKEPIPFEELHRRYWQKQAGAMDELLGLDDSGVTFATAMDMPVRYPFTCALARVQTAILYRHLVEDRRADKGDVRDGGILVHLAAADALVTEDRGLRELAGHVWGADRAVLAFDEYRALLFA